MRETYRVTQSNKLIDARHDVALTAREQKIILTMVSMIQPTDEDFRKYTIPIKEFSEMLGLEGKAKYDDIKEIAQRLQKKSVYIQEEKGFVVTNWVSSQRYIEGEGKIELAFSPELKPYLLQLKNQFTSYRLSNILSLKSAYSIRLYELIKKWQHLGKWECSVNHLKLHMGATTSTFDRYNLFKVRVLELAIKELNEKTDINISFEEIKKGRKIEIISFKIYQNPEKELQIEDIKQKQPKQKKILINEDRRIRLNQLANEYELDQLYFSNMDQVASLIWGDRAEDELSMLIEYINGEESIKNPLGFIRRELEKAWEVFDQNEITITFANKKPSKRKTGREEIIPDWLNKEYKEPELTEEEKEEQEEKLKDIDNMLNQFKSSK